MPPRTLFIGEAAVPPYRALWGYSYYRAVIQFSLLVLMHALCCRFFILYTHHGVGGTGWNVVLLYAYFSFKKTVPFNSNPLK